MFISYLFDVIVMGLLATTITYCYILNTRLRCLRAHESELRTSIAQLFSASKKVEAAVGGLKEHSSTIKENDDQDGLLAEDAAIELKRQISEAKLLMSKLQNVVKTAKSKGLSSDKLLNREAPKAKPQVAAPTTSAQTVQQAQPAQPTPKRVNAPTAQMPQLPEPQPLSPAAPSANQNQNKFGRKQKVAGGTNGGQEAIDRLEASISQIKRNNGRAA